MIVTEIINIIHEQGIENEVFELLTQWMIEDRYNLLRGCFNNMTSNCEDDIEDEDMTESEE